MKTTILLDDALLVEAKQRAAHSGVSLTVVIEEALRDSFGRHPERNVAAPIQFSTWGRGWLQPGVDLNDSASVLDILDREDAPR